MGAYLIVGLRSIYPRRDQTVALRSAWMLVVGSIVIRVHDLPRQLEFWSRALDYLPREGDDDTFALLRPRDGKGPNVSLDTMRSEVQIPPRIHLDLYADDRAAEVERLKSLGATDVEWSRKPADADYTILADPEGNRFCVIDAADWFTNRA
jgi:predicted enzyme related to lactoylglutathione lyase